MIAKKLYIQFFLLIITSNAFSAENDNSLRMMCEGELYSVVGHQSMSVRELEQLPSHPAKIAFHLNGNKLSVIGMMEFETANGCEWAEDSFHCSSDGPAGGYKSVISIVTFSRWTGQIHFEQEKKINERIIDAKYYTGLCKKIDKMQF